MCIDSLYATRKTTFIKILPAHANSSLKCSVCKQTVRSNNKRLVCSNCFDVNHAKCSTNPYQNVINAKIQYFYTYSKCLHTVLPFARSETMDLNVDIENFTINESSYDLNDLFQNLGLSLIFETVLWISRLFTRFRMVFQVFLGTLLATTIGDSTTWVSLLQYLFIGV